MIPPSPAAILEFLQLAQLSGWPRNIARRTDIDFAGFEQTTFEREPWRYIDIWSGATTDIGLQTVSYQSTPVWGCAYRGGIIDPRFLSPDENPVFRFLVDALKRRDRSPLAIRGPCQHEDGAWSYAFDSSGDMDSFLAVERITLNRALVYERLFIGGRQGDGISYGRALDPLAMGDAHS
jgi:hypothetical protein